MAPQPTIEQRIEAAMALAGLDYDELADKIATKNYGSRTLRRITDPEDTARQARGPDLHLIGQACGVSDAFWTVDFAQLEEPSLRQEVSDTRDELQALSRNVADLKRQLQAIRDQGLQREPQRGGQQ